METCSGKGLGAERLHVLEHSFRTARARTVVIGEEVWDAFTEVRGALGEIAADRVLWVPDEGGGTDPEHGETGRLGNDGGLAISCRQTAIHVPTDVTELETSTIRFIELDEALHFGVDKILVPLGHRADVAWGG